MSKVFVKSLLLTMLTVIILTACGTASTPAASTLAPAYPPPGYPNGAVSVPTGAAPSSGSVSFATDILPIFENNCLKCHGGDKTEKGLDLKTYASAMLGSQNGVVIVAGNAGSSKLFMSVASGKMPKRGPKLTQQEIELIMQWINSGASNN